MSEATALQNAINSAVEERNKLIEEKGQYEQIIPKIEEAVEDLKAADENVVTAKENLSGSYKGESSQKAEETLISASGSIGTQKSNLEDAGEEAISKKKIAEQKISDLNKQIENYKAKLASINTELKQVE